MTAAQSAQLPDAPRSRTAELFGPGLRGLTIGIVSTITLVALESLAIGTVMPRVADDLHDLELYGWVYSAFFLSGLIGVVVVGGALDRMPLRRPFAIGLGLFATGLLVGGLAPSMPVLVAARFVQGLGAGAIPPTAYVAIGRSYPARLRPPMFAMMSTAWALPGVIGPSIAALVGQVLGWRWVFLGLLPLLAVAGAIALVAIGVVPRAPAAGHATDEHEAAVSSVRRLPNALLVAAGAGILVAAITSPQVGVVLGGTIAGLALMVPALRRLTPPGTLTAARGLPAAVLLRGVMTFAFFSADAYIPVLLQSWRATPPALTGLVFTATTLAWTAGTWIQSRRVDRVGPRRFAAIGFATVVIGGLATLPVLLAAVPPEAAIVTWSITGIGMGFGYSAFSLIVLRDAAPAAQGAASSALQLSDGLGTALGTGVAGAILAAGVRSAAGGAGDALGIALAAAFGMATLVAAGGLIATRRLPSDRTRSASRNVPVAALD